ncbi:MAG: Ldh family oxidoreductase, partial [Halomonas sp.]
VSQVFIAFAPTKLSSENFLNETVSGLINYLHDADPAEGHSNVSYPGERTLQTRIENLEKGIPVDDGIWETVLNL